MSILFITLYVFQLFYVSVYIDVDRFIKLFHYQIAEEILYTHAINILSHLKCVSTLPCETLQLQLLPISTAYCIWDLRIHFARYEAALRAQVWTMWLWNLENNAAVLKRGSVMSANRSKGWLTCNMGCSRQWVMKLAPVNGVNVSSLCLYPRGPFSALASEGWTDAHK